ncbi:MAG: NADH-quinone oxidoreductase subunit J [Nibricoccus sp.]
MLPNILFYLFAAVTLGFAAAVVFNKNTVNAAVCLLVSLVGVAGVFALLDALLLSVLLILVYAGAVVALFLFIVMLLKPQENVARPYKKLSLVAGIIAAAILGLGVWSFATRSGFSSAPATAEFAGGLKEYGTKLFSTYLLPVQVVGFLLLVAMLGVIVLSKKFEDQEAAK